MKEFKFLKTWTDTSLNYKRITARTWVMSKNTQTHLKEIAKVNQDLKSEFNEVIEDIEESTGWHEDGWHEDGIEKLNIPLEISVDFKIK